MRESKSFRSVAWDVALLALCLGLVLVTTRRFGLFLDFFPIDGDLQTFNPVYRLIQGQKPGIDFDLYLGLGMTSAIRFVARLLGDNFSAVKWAAYFLNGAAFFLTPLICLLLVRVRFSVAALLSALAYFACSNVWLQNYMHEFNRQPMLMLYALGINVEPGVSLRMLRSTLPAVACGWMLFVHRFLSKGSSRRRRLTWALAGGIGAGLAAPWSSDYGPITSCLILGIAFLRIVFAGKTESDRSGILDTLGALLVLAASAAATFLGFFIVTAGSLHAMSEWWTYWRTISRESFWYYDFPAAKVLTLKAALPNPILWLAGGMSAFLLAVSARNLRPFSDDKFPLFLAGLLIGTQAVSAWLLSVLGRITPEYLHVTYITFALLAAGFFGKMAIDASSKRKPEGKKWLSFTSQIALAIVTALVAIRAGEIFAFGRNLQARSTNEAPAQMPPKNGWAMAAGAKSGPVFFVSELGGYLSSGYQNDVLLARSIRDSAPGKISLFSTYSGFYEPIIGTINPTRSDYLIHSISRENLLRTVENLEQRPPEYILTINPEYTSWETWVRAQHWDFYRFVLRNYTVTRKTPLYLVWRKRETPVEDKTSWVECKVSQTGPAGVTISIPPSNRPQDEPDGMAEVEVEYEAIKGSSLRAISYLTYDSSHLGCGTPLGRNRRVFPLPGRPAEGASFTIKIQPGDGAQLRIIEARARWLGSEKQLFSPAP